MLIDTQKHKSFVAEQKIYEDSGAGGASERGKWEVIVGNGGGQIKTNIWR